METPSRSSSNSGFLRYESTFVSRVSTPLRKEDKPHFRLDDKGSLDNGRMGRVNECGRQLGGTVLTVGNCEVTDLVPTTRLALSLFRLYALPSAHSIPVGEGEAPISRHYRSPQRNQTPPGPCNGASL